MKVGIQLYSVRQSMAQDPITTIRKVVNEGYRHLEVANHTADKDNGVGFGVTANELKHLLDDVGAVVMSAHVMPLQSDLLGPILEYNNIIGTKYIVNPIGFYRDHDEVKRLSAEMNKMGETCKAAGIQLAYHNHFHEFQHIDGKELFSTLVEETDRELVKFEVDCYWAMRAGKDPAQLLKELGKRVCLLHQKDYPAGYDSEMNMLNLVEAEHAYVDMDRFVRDMREETFVEIGTGIMDIQQLITVGNEICEAEYIVLEQDYTRLGEIESIRLSAQNFKKYSGIEWD